MADMTVVQIRDRYAATRCAQNAGARGLDRARVESNCGRRRLMAGAGVLALRRGGPVKQGVASLL